MRVAWRSISRAAASSVRGAELESEPGRERPVLRPVPESSDTSGSSFSLVRWLGNISKSSVSGEKLFSREMVYDWNTDSPAARLVAALKQINF